jgi:hypothetical protein
MADLRGSNIRSLSRLRRYKKYLSRFRRVLEGLGVSRRVFVKKSKLPLSD